MAQNIDAQDDNMTFWDHLEVLRYTLMRSVAAVVVFSVIAFFFKEFIYGTIILGPKSADFISNRLFCQLGHFLNTDSLCINRVDFPIVNFELGGQFRSHMLITFVSGIIISMPYILTEIWLFIRPALSVKERKGISGFVIITSFLFLIGLSFGYFIIVPLALDFLYTYTLTPDIVNTIRLDSYISTVVMISISTGIVFELPVLIYFLARMGIVTAVFLKTYRKHAIVILIILSAIITPPDIFSQILVATPLLGLYEISIIIAKRVEKQRIKEL
ncbi:MAG: twin arginine-targeting protein translocase TatC [Bacteroidetes bacterium CG2_30_33_31]|nr:MAG: twin arginine-targeting protein translocase TatC [Bacteroidetes bacterium CG2_30_33_31]